MGDFRLSGRNSTLMADILIFLRMETNAALKAEIVLKRISLTSLTAMSPVKESMLTSNGRMNPSKDRQMSR